MFDQTIVIDLPLKALASTSSAQKKHSKTRTFVESPTRTTHTYRGSDVFHDQPPVDDYANYWRNVIMGTYRAES